MKQILIIEDDATLAQTLEDNLIHEGFDVLRANDGARGLLVALSAKPDLILLDILMPKVDGLTMLDTLRKDAWGKGVPVIVMSNLNDAPEVAWALGDGVCEYMVKADWKMDDVIKRIRENLAPEVALP